MLNIAARKDYSDAKPVLLMAIAFIIRLRAVDRISTMGDYKATTKRIINECMEEAAAWLETLERL